MSSTAQHCVNPSTPLPPQSTNEQSTAVVIRTVNGKEAKEVNTVKSEIPHTKKIMEELRSEIKEMITAAMEVSCRTVHARCLEMRRKGCKKCQEEHVGDSSQHCFKCGLSGHLSRRCRLQSPQSGSEQGLLGRDHQ